MKGQLMSKSRGPGIIDMPAERVAPRRSGGANEVPPFGARAPGRTPVATYLEQSQLSIVQVLLGHLRGERGRRVTMQEALGEALKKWCKDHDVELS
jgi:hypothetical protein